MSSDQRLTITVLIATNRPRLFLDEALASVKEQTLRPLEVIVVDDGSEDSAVYDRLENRAVITKLLRQDALGVSIAWNRGLHRAEGDLVAVLGDDDRWPSGRLEAHEIALREHPEATFSVDETVNIDTEGQVMFRSPLPPHISASDVRSRDHGVMLGNCVFRREAAVLVGGFHPALKRVQDFDLLLNLLRLGGPVRAHTYFEYRNHPGNATTRHREVADFQVVVSKLHATWARWNGEPTAESDLRRFESRAKRFAGWSAGRAARRHIHEGRLRGALAEGRWLITSHPSAFLEWGRKRLLDHRKTSSP